MLEPGCNCRRQCTTLVISLLLIILTYVMTVKRKFCLPGGREGRACGSPYHVRIGLLGNNVICRQATNGEAYTGLPHPLV